MLKRTDFGNTIVGYQIPSVDGDVFVGVGMVGLVYIHVPEAAQSSAILSSELCMEALIDADEELSRRHRVSQKQEWLDKYLQELRDEIENQALAGSTQQLDLFTDFEVSSHVVSHDMGF